ncbi:unnamed protein product [Caenorhabditis bovis]|uniref:LNS2/PITP domain-containing protein n=1 Tax=Caenorhabditis bovis TaxID=2654633 RepID=A0A8S1EDH3_9PELO|nr:unnamed protein product [Caenorhabditis bovis]
MALGGGAELAMMCDIVYCGDDALFGQPEIIIGTIPGAGATQRMPRVAGKSFTMETILTGNRYNAFEAKRNGIVSKIFPRENLVEESIKTAERIARHCSISVLKTKQVIKRAYEMPLREAERIDAKGAIDVVVVEQPNGEYKSTPFHVRFGKYGVFSYNDKYVDISVNGYELDLKMKLADSGVAFFVEETDETVPDYLLTSPLPEKETTAHSNSDIDKTLADKTLAETVQKLEHQSAEYERENDNLEEKSRSSSPDGGQGKAREPKQEQSLSQVQRKHTLPLQSSVFSDRRYRSLPDLTVLDDDGLQGEHDKYENNRAKESEDVPKNKKPRPFLHSHSQCSNLDRKMAHKSNDEIINSLRRETHDFDRKFPSRKKSRVTFVTPVRSKPIAIMTTEYNDSESEFDSSVASSVNSSPSPSLVDQREIDRIADGALSDSEIDRQRDRNSTPEAHDVTDWKWGELPETRETNNKRQAPKSQIWSWKFWSSRSNEHGEPAYEEQEQGITLEELEKATSDPINMEKYLGKPQSVASFDSGHVSRGVSQPSSPVSTHNDYIGEPSSSTEKTPTKESMQMNDFEEKGHRCRASSDLALSEDELEEKIQNGQKYMQSLRLSSDKLKSLNLVHGANECRFSITTKYQGTTWCSCNIYLYKWYEQLVISDIDGTITKSDVLGHVIPAIGGTWAHAGVAELYTRIKNNGYKMVYLSSRAIGQSHTTKQYLKSVAQDSKQLPDGPVLLSPTSILTAFRREVIERRPEEFKIAALADLKQLFPTGNPYYAGFGNRETDVVSYRAVKVPPARILIIDSSGRVKRADSVGIISSYKTMANETVDYLFPPLSIHVRDDVKKTERLASAWSKPLEHSDFTHWKVATEKDVIDIDDEELKAYEEKRKISMLTAKKK